MRSPLLRWVVVVAALSALAVPASALGVANIREQNDGLPDYDVRSGALAPTSAQRAVVRRLGARATWNKFGTPATLSKRGKYLATNIHGKNASFAYMDMYAIAHGQIVEVWHVEDLAGMMRQLGMLPA